jgi:hypothetical protein
MDEGYPFHKKIETVTLMRFFKKNSCEGKTVGYEDFKYLIS